MDVFQEAKTKPISIVSVYSYIPSRRAESKETTYFNCESKVLVQYAVFDIAQLATV